MPSRSIPLSRLPQLTSWPCHLASRLPPLTPTARRRPRPLFLRHDLLEGLRSQHGLLLPFQAHRPHLRLPPQEGCSEFYKEAEAKSGTNQTAKAALEAREAKRAAKGQRKEEATPQSENEVEKDGEGRQSEDASGRGSGAGSAECVVAPGEESAAAAPSP